MAPINETFRREMQKMEARSEDISYYKELGEAEPLNFLNIILFNETIHELLDPSKHPQLHSKKGIYDSGVEVLNETINSFIDEKGQFNYIYKKIIEAVHNIENFNKYDDNTKKLLFTVQILVNMFNNIKIYIKNTNFTEQNLETFANVFKILFLNYMGDLIASLKDIEIGDSIKYILNNLVLIFKLLPLETKLRILIVQISNQHNTITTPNEDVSDVFINKKHLIPILKPGEQIYKEQYNHLSGFLIDNKDNIFELNKPSKELLEELILIQQQHYQDLINRFKDFVRIILTSHKSISKIILDENTIQLLEQFLELNTTVNDFETQKLEIEHIMGFFKKYYFKRIEEYKNNKSKTQQDLEHNPNIIWQTIRDIYSKYEVITSYYKLQYIRFHFNESSLIKIDKKSFKIIGLTLGGKIALSQITTKQISNIEIDFHQILPSNFVPSTQLSIKDAEESDLADKLAKTLIDEENEENEEKRKQQQEKIRLQQQQDDKKRLQQQQQLQQKLQTLQTLKPEPSSNISSIPYQQKETDELYERQMNELKNKNIKDLQDTINLHIKTLEDNIYNENNISNIQQLIINLNNFKENGIDHSLKKETTISELLLSFDTLLLELTKKMNFLKTQEAKFNMIELIFDSVQNYNSTILNYINKSIILPIDTKLQEMQGHIDESERKNIVIIPFGSRTKNTAIFGSDLECLVLIRNLEYFKHDMYLLNKDLQDQVYDNLNKLPNNIVRQTIREIKETFYSKYKDDIAFLKANFNNLLNTLEPLQFQLESSTKEEQEELNFYYGEVYKVTNNEILKILDNKIEFYFANPNFTAFGDINMYDNIQIKYPAFLHIVILLKHYLKQLYQENFPEDKDIKNFLKGTNIEVITAYFLQKFNIETELNPYTLYEIINNLNNFIDNLHNETYIYLENPFDYLGNEITEKEDPIFKYHLYKINYLKQQDLERTKTDPNYELPTQVIHPISNEYLWFGNINHPSKSNLKNLLLLLNNKLQKDYLL